MRPNFIRTPAGEACFTVEGAFSVEECRRFIARFEAMGYDRTGASYPQAYRSNDRLLIDDEALAAHLFARLAAHLPPRVTDGRGRTWDLAGFNTRFRSCRYRDGQGFEIHRDGAFSPSDRERSMLTVMFYLNDAAEFEGGATRFLPSRTTGAEAWAEIAPKAGTAIVFDHRLWHEGQAVVRGTKYVLRTDVMYRAVEDREVENREVEDRDPLLRGAPENARAEPQGLPGVLRPSAVLAGHRGYVFAGAWLKDGALATGSRDGTLRIWCPSASGEWRSQVVEHGCSITVLAEGPEGTIWTGTRLGDVRVFERRGDGARCVAERRVHPGAVLALCRLRDGCMASAGAGGDVRIFGPGIEDRARFDAHAGWVWALADSPDGLWSASEDGTVRLWGPERVGRATIGRAPQERVFAPGFGAIHALLPRAGGAIIGCADGTVCSLVDGSSVRLHTDCATGLAALGRWILSASDDGTIAAWDPVSGECASVRAHDDFVRGLACGPEGPDGGGLLASWSYDGTVRLWRTGRQTRSASRPRFLETRAA